jgi:uncharacterized membrane protein
VFYLTWQIWWVVAPLQLTYALMLEAALVGTIGWSLLSSPLRIYGFIVALIAALRFCLWDALTGLGELARWTRLGVAIACVYFIYFLQLNLKRRKLLEGNEPELLAPLFSMATFLLGLTIFEYIKSPWISVAFGVSGVALFAIGFAIKDKLFRLGGLVLFGITLAHIVFVDLSVLSILYKIISFIVLGILFLGVSFVYTKLNVKDE